MTATTDAESTRAAPCGEVGHDQVARDASVETVVTPTDGHAEDGVADGAVDDPSANAELKLLFAACNGDIDEVRRLLEEEDADPTAEDEEGRTSLFFAAAGGHLEIVKMLMEIGQHPWNALDAHGETAADFALAAGHTAVWDAIVAQGVRAERLFGALRRMSMTDDERRETNNEYLAQRVHYTSDGTKLLDADGNGVMMGWEAPLMAETVKRIAPKDGLRVLNVGFGLGIIDALLQKTRPAEHHVIEAHPDVLAHFRAGAAPGIPDPEVITMHEGAWQDIVPELVAAGIQFDAIYFDTYAEADDDLLAFHAAAAQLLAPERGRYAWFHGGGASHALFNAVCKEIAEEAAVDLGLHVEWERVPLAPLGDDIWHGVRMKYFALDHFWIPICTKPIATTTAQQ